MSERTIQEFCDRHGACPEGREWALAHCQTMADVWRQARPLWLIWVATQQGVLTNRHLRLFAAWSARQVQHLMTDPRSIAALEVAERHANGEATDEELAAACAAACAAAREVAGKEAREAARAAAWVAARVAAREVAGEEAREAALAAHESAWVAAFAAARVAAWVAADEEARVAAWVAQSDWLRANTVPNFNAKEKRR